MNEAVNKELVERVVSEVLSRGAKTFLDLYCGSGNFALPLLEEGLSGSGVEMSPEAIALAQAEADERGYPGQFHAQSCGDFLKKLAACEADVVILDPPRAGAKECVPEILRLKPPVLIMIACDPASLARDVGDLKSGGYRLHALEAFDMFPQTHHVETLAILELEESARLSPSES